MKILYFGGQKSGKSKLAEQKALAISKDSKPIYIATYNNIFGDNQMNKKIQNHKLQRENNFITIEESFDLTQNIKENKTYLIECVSMWIFNNLNKKKRLIKQLEYLFALKNNIVFVLNDVSNSIVPANKASRNFVDLTGIIGQKIASSCDEVYEIKFGIPTRLK